MHSKNPLTFVDDSYSSCRESASDSCDEVHRRKRCITRPCKRYACMLTNFLPCMQLNYDHNTYDLYGRCPVQIRYWSPALSYSVWTETFIISTLSE
jgi:hypothetical protein